MRTHTITRVLAATVLAAGAMAVTACGEEENGSGTTNAERQANRDAALKFAECMRENGVPMEDPGSGGRQVLKVGPSEDVTPEEMEAAQKACEKYQKEIEPPDLSEEQQQEFKDAALAHAKCMREHGIENFPDPTFDQDGGAQIRIGPGSGLDPEDPDFQKAQEACRDELPQPPAGANVQEPR